MRRTEKQRAARVPRWLKVTSGVLLVILLLGTWAFTQAYTDLNRSIHRERVESVQQISDLISKKLSLLKQLHDDETVTAAHFLSHSGATSMEQVNELMGHLDDICLLMDDGRCLSLDGSALVISSPMLSEDLSTWSGVRSGFCTVQSLSLIHI